MAPPPSSQETALAEFPDIAVAGRDGGDPAGPLADQDEFRRLPAGLPRQQRAVIILRYYEDLPDAEIGAHLLYAVRRRARRTTVRRRVAAGGTAALAIGVAVPVMVVSYQGYQGRGGTDTVLTAPSTTPGRPPTGHLVRAAYRLPDIPVTPGWLPGTVPQWTASSFGLEYRFGGGIPGVRIQVKDNDGFLAVDSGDHTTVNGVPAIVAHNIKERGQTVLTLVWQRRPGQWVSVAWMGGTGGADRTGTDSATLVHLAEDLRDAGMTVREPYRLAWLPRDAVFAGVFDDEMEFRLPDGAMLTVKRAVRAKVGTGDYLVLSGPTSLDQADVLGIAEGLTLLK